MNKKIRIKTKNNIYSINIEPNSTVKNLYNIIASNNKVVFLIDRKVFYIFKNLKHYKKQKYIVIDCSEKLKSFSNYAKISEKILNFKIDRGTKIVAIVWMRKNIAPGETFTSLRRKISARRGRNRN